MEPVQSVIWLLAGGALELFGPGKWRIPLAPWLGAMFLLRFSRSHKLLPGCLAVGLVLFLAVSVANRGVLMVPGPGYFGVVALISALSTLPFVIDRLLGPRLPGAASTLVFPLAYVAMEWINGRVSLFGTWGSLAYTQYGNLPLMQLASVTGIWGLTFLIAWFGSMGEWVWASGFAWSTVRSGVLVYAAVLCMALFFGGARLALSPSDVPTVRMAGIGWPPGIIDRGRLYPLLLDDQLTADVLERARQDFARVNRAQLEETRREARAGARLVAWTETSAIMFDGDRQSWIGEAQRLAREEGIYLLIGALTIHRDRPQPRADNEAWLFTPEGEMPIAYRKAYEIPPAKALTLLGEKRIPTFDSAIGRLATAICFDLDMPAYARQAGLSGSDILLAPYGDFEPIKELHAAMAAFRSIENGVSLVRPAQFGLSTAVDPYGRVLATMDQFNAGQLIMVAQVPTAGIRTVYSVLGDWFAWLSLGALTLIALWSVAYAVLAR